MTARTDLALEKVVRREGVHVVHFWAPWCDNSRNELDDWRRAIDAHDDVTFAFVTVWNDGEIGVEVLAEHGIADRVETLVIPGPKPEKEDRRLTVLGLPVTWIPTTWVFNRNGLLAYAFSYGEVTGDQLAEAFRAAQSGW